MNLSVTSHVSWNTDRQLFFRFDRFRGHLFGVLLTAMFGVACGGVDGEAEYAVAVEAKLTADHDELELTADQDRMLNSDEPCVGLSAIGASYCSYASDVPDFDQKRAGDLAGDGSMHCLPTTAANILTWLSSRGHLRHYGQYAYENRVDTLELYCAGRDPNNPYTYASDRCSDSTVWTTGQSQSDILGSSFWSAVWSDARHYNSVSNFIEQLGYEMGTQGMEGPEDTPDGSGTDLNPFLDAMSGRVGSEIEINTTKSVNCGQQTFTHLEMNEIIDSGNIAALVIGYYSDGDNNGYDDRTGGHMVTLTGAVRLGFTRMIYFRDPQRMHEFSDINSTRQDPYTKEIGTVELVEVNREILDDDGVQTETCDDVKRWKVTWGGGAKSGYLDTLIEFAP